MLDATSTTTRGFSAYGSFAKTVNQDATSHYHLFYGDELARPGLDLTFFEYRFAVPGRTGPGMVHRIVWRLASERALEFWADRLAAEGAEVERVDAGLRFADPRGPGARVRDRLERRRAVDRDAPRDSG